MVSFQELLESDIALTLIPILGLADSLRLYSTLTKQCHGRVEEFLIQHKAKARDAKLLEDSGRLACAIADGLRQTAFFLRVTSISPRGSALMEQTGGDLKVLRQHGLQTDVNSMNTSMYTNWNSTPGTSYHGVFQEFASRLSTEADKEKQALDEDAQYWLSSRVYGEFIVLFDRPDGAILVSEDCKRVYLVLGLAQSIGEVSNLGYRHGGYYRKPSYPPPKLHGPLLGVIMNATLLNWQGMIIYDGLMMSVAMASKGKIKEALKAYTNAVDQSTLITQLEKKTGSLKEIPVPVVDPDEVRRLKLELFPKLEAVRKEKYRKKTGPFDIIVFRRVGYTEETNADHMVTIFGNHNGMLAPTFFTCRALSPTVEEYVEMLHSVLFTAGKPEYVSVDELSALEMLNAVLDGTGVKASYYSPPSNEEATLQDATNPHMSSGCAVCGVRERSYFVAVAASLSSTVRKNTKRSTGSFTK